MPKYNDELIKIEKAIKNADNQILILNFEPNYNIDETICNSQNPHANYIYFTVIPQIKSGEIFYKVSVVTDTKTNERRKHLPLGNEFAASRLLQELDVYNSEIAPIIDNDLTYVLFSDVRNALKFAELAMRIPDFS